MKTTLLIPGLVLALLGTAQFPGFAQSDDFNDGNDSGWTRYDPFAGLGTPIGSWTFPGGNTYRIQTAESPNLNFGPSRGGSIRSDVNYTNFYVSVDIVDWDPTLNQNFGILARLKEVGVGTTDGYAMTYVSANQDIAISPFTDEDPADFVPTIGNDSVTLEPGFSYRFVFIGRRQELTARVYRHPDLETPLADITGNDITYTSGFCGLINFDYAAATAAGNLPTDVTYDNYFASDAEPPTLSIDYSLFGDLTVAWPTNATGYILQGASTLNPPVWTNLPPPYALSGDQYLWLNTDTTVEAAKYYRLIRP